MRGVCHLSATCVLFGPLCPPPGSPLVTQALLSRSLGSRLLTSVPHCCDIASLKFPQQPLGEPECTILCGKTNDFAKPPVFQKCSLRAPLGPPRLPQGPPRAPQGRPRAPQGVPQEPLGGALGPPKAPPEPPRSTFEHPREASENIGFMQVKRILWPRGGPGSMSGMPLGCPWGPFFSPSAPARFVFGLLWAPRSPFNSSPPVLVSTSPPQGPPRPLSRGQMYPFMQ